MSQAVNAWTQADVLLTGLQALFAFIGTAGLIVSLWFTKQALDLSRKAIEDQARYTRTELAAYMSRTEVRRDITDALKLTIQIRNVGQTPAQRVRGGIRAEIGPREFFVFDRSPGAAFDISDVPPGQVIDLMAGPVLTDAEVDDLVHPEGATAMFLFGWLAWDDVFGHRTAMPFCIAMFGSNLMNVQELFDLDLVMMPPEERAFAAVRARTGLIGRFHTPT